MRRPPGCLRPMRTVFAAPADRYFTGRLDLQTQMSWSLSYANLKAAAGGKIHRGPGRC
jgi:hypothetical protein